MKINKITQKFYGYVYRFKDELKEKQIQKYFQMEDIDFIHASAKEQIFNARKVIANYAKATHTHITITGKNHSNKNITPNIYLQVNDLSHKNSLFIKKVASNTTKTYPKVSHRTFILPIDDGVEIAYQTTNHVEDTFLRNLYRNIEESIKFLKK